MNYSNPVQIDLTQHLIKYLKFIEKKIPEQSPTFGQSNQNKLIFNKLEKSWLMQIPKNEDSKENKPVIKQEN